VRGQGGRPLHLFNHMVGEREQLCWHFEAERLCGLEVDHQLEYARREDKRVRLYSRPGNDLTYRFPLIVEAFAL
jgi:hypothetical protein